MTSQQKAFAECGIFENPTSLSASVVVPTGKVSVSGNMAQLEVWKDNKIVSITVDTEGTYPALLDGEKLAKEYVLHLCAVVGAQEKGVYYIKSLGFSEDENGSYNGINKDKPELLNEKEITAENMFFIKSDVVPISPFRKIDRYYQGAGNKVFVPTKSYFLGDFSFGKYDFDITNWAGRRIRFDAGKTSFAQDFSRVLVKYNFADGKSEWVLFDSAALVQMTDIEFKSVSYIVSNNPTNGPEDESCMAGEDLVFLFGEVDLPESLDVKAVLGEKVKIDVPAALYETMRVRFKTSKALPAAEAVVAYERADGTVGEKKFELTMAGADDEGAYVLEIRMREVEVWQNILSGLTITFPEGEYELDYVKFFATGNRTDVKLGEALPMFSDGGFTKGFKVGNMEGDLVPSDDYFATTPDGDAKREEYEKAVKDDDSVKKKLYPDWVFYPIYTYDYINSWPYIRQAGLTYDSPASERIAAIKKANPEVYQKSYLDYELRDSGKPTEDGNFRLYDVAGSKEIVYKPCQTYTTSDGVERHGNVLEFSLNGSKMFKGQPYSKFDKNNNPDGTWRFWPHLLIEQSTKYRPVDYKTEPQYTTGADRLYCEFDLKLKEYKEEYTRKVHPDGIERDTGHMSFLLYSYLIPKADPKTLLWFGLCLGSDSMYHSQYQSTNWCRDSGANTYMYCLPHEAVFGGFNNSIAYAIQSARKAEDYKKGTKITGDWVHVKVDLSHHIDIILDRVNAEDAYGLGITTRDDWFFNGVNIGFETSDNVDCTFEMANFNFYSYNIIED